MSRESPERRNGLKLIVINSYGPMGASLLGGLVEKLGAVNIPFRKYGLSEYLLGDYALNSGIMQNALKRKLESHSRMIRSGGVGALHHEDQHLKPLTDVERVREEIEDLFETTFSSIDELYLACRTIYAKAVVYKEVAGDPLIHIDYPTDFGEHKKNVDKLYNAYFDNFDDVRMIFLHREFEGWINAVAAQIFRKRRFIDQCKFTLRSQLKHYRNYEEAVGRLPGLHIDFEELFSKQTEILLEEIREFFDIPAISCNLRDESYDLYGKLVPFQKAFTPFHDQQEFLDPTFRKYCAKFGASTKSIGPAAQAYCRLRFASCYIKYRLRNGWVWRGRGT